MVRYSKNKQQYILYKVLVPEHEQHLSSEEGLEILKSRLFKFIQPEDIIIEPKNDSKIHYCFSIDQRKFSISEITDKLEKYGYHFIL